MNLHDRLIKERERLGFNQDQMAAAGGMKKRAYCYYESGERSPDASFLAGIAKLGADVRYIVTGDRDGPAAEVLSADERYLLERFRRSPQSLKDAALRVLLGGEPPPAKVKKQVNVSAAGGQAAGRNIVNNGGKS